MDEAALGVSMELLGRFNDEMTRVVDAVFGTRWAEIEEILAFVGLSAERSLSTRRLAEMSGLGRRAVSRLIARLESEGLATTRRSDADRRVIEVVLTGLGDDRAALLRTSTTDFLLASGDIARRIRDGLAGAGRPHLAGAPADPLDLLRRVCEAGAALVRHMPEAATQGQLAARQRAALVQILSQGDVRPHELARSLDVSPAGAVYIVDQLCAKGFVVRRFGAVSDDRRAVVLEATAEGAQAVLAVMAGIEQHREQLVELFDEVASWRPDDRGTGGAVRGGSSGSRRACPPGGHGTSRSPRSVPRP
ncbi:MarR family transcriptional regulator [Herbiconiux sp. A18JL235]|uniref:MarR family transcriptional regulator n=1 Tax=Herbiconiux sp. A18JL235 TaxID=3152363 RepID=A0AB39BCG0_9MICO